jgi:hypothetical protein
MNTRSLSLYDKIQTFGIETRTCTAFWTSFVALLVVSRQQVDTNLVRSFTFLCSRLHATQPARDLT